MLRMMAFSYLANSATSWLFARLPTDVAAGDTGELLVLGVLMVVGALGYLTHSYGSWLYPNYAETLALVVGVTAIIGELPFFLWLAIKGVDVQRFNERAHQQPR